MLNKLSLPTLNPTNHNTSFLISVFFIVAILLSPGMALAAKPPGVPPAGAAGIRALVDELVARVDTLEQQTTEQQSRIDELQLLTTTQASRIATLESQNAEQTTRISNLETGYNSLNQDVLALRDSVGPLLTYFSVDSNGNVVLSGTNLLIQSGAGTTDAEVNGKGNLIIGYNIGGGVKDQSGSHNFVVGDWHTFNSYGSFISGHNNWVTAPYTSVVGGHGNSASGYYAVVSGGNSNSASGDFSAVSGGSSNGASGDYSSIGGGEDNSASGSHSSVTGGYRNQASGSQSSVSGGFDNIAGGPHSSVSGGRQCEMGSTFVNGWASGGINPGCPVNNFDSL